MQQPLDTRTKLLTKSPFPLMIELAIPAVLGMVVVGLYNMMDSIFVGQMVGDVQMGAVSMSYPFTLINAGSAAMIGVGSASVLSRAIGKKDQDTVKKIMGNLVAMVLLMSVVYMVIGMVFTRQLLPISAISRLSPSRRTGSWYATPMSHWSAGRYSQRPRLSGKRRRRGGKSPAKKVPYTENILRGRVFCGCCGRNLHRQRHQCGYYVYHCISNDRIGKGACEAKVYVREPDLFNAILTIIRQKAEVVMGEALRLKRCDGKIAAQKAQVDQEINELGRQMQKDKAIRAGLYESFVKGILTRAEYLEMQEDYNRKISGAVERVQQLQTRQAELKRQVARYTSMADKLAAVDKDTALSALLVNQLIGRVTVNGPDDVSIDFAFESGFERVMEVLGNE